MATENARLEPPPERSAIGRYWEKIATALSVVSLVDLSEQFIKWAKHIHWVVENYKVAKVWLFGWLPFHIPPDWHDFIILFCIFFSVTNVGLYKRTGRTYISYVIVVVAANGAHWLLKPLGMLSRRAKEIETKLNDFVQRQTVGNLSSRAKFNDKEFISMMLVLLFASIVTWSVIDHFFGKYIESNLPLHWLPSAAFSLLIILIFFIIVMYPILFGILIAWRWIVTTAALFVALVVVNEVYVRWLQS
ncbi:MAG: hypothetical protein ACLPKB_15190 [Xanthobacteraceae bacterium]